MTASLLKEIFIATIVISMVFMTYQYIASKTIVTKTSVLNPDMTETVTYNINFDSTR